MKHEKYEPIARLCAHSLTFPDFLAGPSKWGGVCQTGQSQTPIDIKSEDTTWKKDFGAFNLVNYDQTPSFNFTASNNGHTFQIAFVANYYIVSGAGLVGTFTTVQFHLHWGATNAKGSEHFLDGKQYAAEVRDFVLQEPAKSRNFELFWPPTKSVTI